MAYGKPFTGACHGLPSSHHSEMQSAASDLLLLDTEKLIGHVQTTLGRVRRKKAGTKEDKWSKLSLVYAKPRDEENLR